MVIGAKKELNGAIKSGAGLCTLGVPKRGEKRRFNTTREELIS